MSKWWARPLFWFFRRREDKLALIDEGGASRLVDACAADEVKLAKGMVPIATGRRREPVERLPSEPGPVPPRRPKPQGKEVQKTPGAFQVPPPGLAERHRAAGRGGSEFKLAWLDSPTPLVLVVRFHGSGPNQADLVQGARKWTLLRREDRGRTVVPLPVHGSEDVHLLIETRAKWSAWVQAGDTVPVIEARYASHGSFVLRYLDGPARFHMEHRARGVFSVTELTSEFEQGRRVLSGNGRAAATGELAEPAFLHVRAEGDWQITVTPR